MKYSDYCATSIMALRDGMTIPSVSPDELLAFQQKHFGRADDKSNAAAYSQYQSTKLQIDDKLIQENAEELGFYHEGTPRTLTNAQIAIFRHSEIEQLVKAYNQYLADQDEDEKDHGSPTCDDALNAVTLSPMSFLAFAESVRQKHILDQARKDARSQSGLNAQDSQYPSRSGKTRKRNLEKRRARNKRRKLEKTVQAYQDNADEDQRTYRRIAREKDEEAKDGDEVMLEY